MRYILLVIISFFSFNLLSQTNISERAKWFVDQRFGMFIHWGLYSSAEGVWKGENLRNNNQYAEWIQYRNRVSDDQYIKLIDKFNWKKIDPEKWVLLAKESGMKYITLTAKHHDGFALWNSKASEFNIYEKSKNRRDIVKELADACEKHGIKLGLYYSHWIDWNDSRSWDHRDEIYGLDPDLYDDYWQEKVIPQMTELLTNYGEISIIWFDMWIHHSKTIVTKEQLFQLKKLIRELQPKCLINSRLGLSIEEDSDVDFRTLGDNQLGKEKLEYPWQTPATIANSWGFNANEYRWKSTTSILKALIGNVSLNGNLMLNIGPRYDGSLRYESLLRLNEIGDWLKVNGSSIYGAGAYDLNSDLHDWGKITYKNNDKHKIYLHIINWPVDNNLFVTGIKSKPVKIYSLSDKSKEPLSFYHKDVLTKIDLPSNPVGKYVSVFVIEYDEKPQAMKGLVGKNFERGFSLNLQNYHMLKNNSGINKKTKYGTIPENISLSSEEVINWKIFIDEPGKYLFDTSYSNQSDKDLGDIVVFVDNKQVLKGNFKPTGKTVGEPLKDWHIKNFKSHRIGEVEFKNSGIYDITIHLKSRKKNIINWSWMWIKLDEN